MKESLGRNGSRAGFVLFCLVWLMAYQPLWVI